MHVDKQPNCTTPPTTDIVAVVVSVTVAVVVVSGTVLLVIAVSIFLIIKFKKEFKSQHLSFLPQSVPFPLTTITQVTNNYCTHTPPTKLCINESALLDHPLGTDTLSYVSDGSDDVSVDYHNKTVRRPVNPIVVLSQYTPEPVKNEILSHLLGELKQYCSEDRIMAPIHPDTDKEAVRQPGSEWMWNIINSYDDTPESPCFLCVVNREFKTEWRNCSSRGSDNHSLVYVLSRYIVGLSRYSNRINDQVILLFLNGIDETLVPTPLKECCSVDVTNLKEIAFLVLKEPVIVLSD